MMTTWKREPSPLGAVVAVTICSVIAVGGALIYPDGGWIFGLAGMPVTFFLGWRFAPEVVGSSGLHLLATALWFGAKTILLTDAVAIGASAGGTLVAGIPWVFADRTPLEWPLYLVGGLIALIIFAFVAYLIGMAVVGIPISFVVFPAALIWVVALKLATRGPGGPRGADVRLVATP